MVICKWGGAILARADHQPARAAQLHRRVPGLRDQCRRADSQAFREPHKFAGAFRSCRSSARSSERSERCRTYVILRCLLYTSPAKLTLQASSRFDHIYYHSAEFVARATASAAITFRPKKIRNLPRTYQTCTKRSMTLRSKYHWLSLRRVRVRVRVRVNESMIERLALALVFWSGPPHL
jgi:hypothetical protein